MKMSLKMQVGRYHIIAYWTFNGHIIVCFLNNFTQKVIFLEFLLFSITLLRLLYLYKYINSRIKVRVWILGLFWVLDLEI